MVHRNIIAIATNGSLTLMYYDEVDNDNQGAIITNSTYQTPYMKGPRVAAYPLNDVNDRSGNGHTLTNNGTTPFTGTSPLGVACADFDGSSMYLEVADSDALGNGESALTISAFIRPDVPGAAQAIVSKFDESSGTDNSYTLELDGAGQTRFAVRASGAAVQINAGPVLSANTWYHVCGTWDGVNIRLYVDSVLVATLAQAGAALHNSTKPLVIGAAVNGAGHNHYFDGEISQVSISFAAWTAAEVNMEYQRMIRGLAGATATLGADDVDSVRIDPNTGLMAVCVNNQVEIWNAELGLRESIDAVSTPTLNNADIRLEAGADNPLYISGRSAQIDVVSPQRRVMG